MSSLDKEITAVLGPNAVPVGMRLGLAVRPLPPQLHTPATTAATVDRAKVSSYNARHADGARASSGPAVGRQWRACGHVYGTACVARLSGWRSECISFDSHNCVASVVRAQQLQQLQQLAAGSSALASGGEFSNLRERRH